VVFNQIEPADDSFRNRASFVLETAGRWEQGWRLTPVGQLVTREALVFSRLTDQCENRDQNLEGEEDQWEVHANPFASGGPLGAECKSLKRQDWVEEQTCAVPEMSRLGFQFEPPSVRLGLSLTQDGDNVVYGDDSD
jgi:hypothetical protein